MKYCLLICAVLVAALNGLALLPAMREHATPLTAAALVLALLTALFALLTGAKTAPTTPPVPAAVPPPAPAANQAEAEVVAFFGLLQEKGRLVDFLMDDVTGYDDAQVGAAARVVHQGCREVLREHFKITPVSTAAEGSRVTVPAGYAPDEYRLLGKISGEAPFTGTLIHKGWKTESVKLPRIIKADAQRLPGIAPAEVELK
ncbi:MAG: DUF2760 domain-containing protein [Chthoniobacteraceae bacterium]